MPVRPLNAGVRFAAVALLLGAGVMLSAPPAAADSVPFTDANAHGYLGLCDATGHKITSGDIGTAPLAAFFVSSVPAPQGYTAGYGKAVVNVYQPRKGVEPGEWTGKNLTSGSTFTSTAHPMAEGTVLDPALVDFTSVSAPKWDGLVQLRMYFGAVNRPQHTIPYPALVLRVSGQTWSVVNAATVDCHAGNAQSVEHLLLPKSSFANAVRSTPTAVPKGGLTSTPTAGAAASSNSVPGEVDPSDEHHATNSGGASKTAAPRNGSKAWTGAVAALAVAVLAAGGWWGWRRRRIA